MRSCLYLWICVFQILDGAWMTWKSISCGKHCNSRKQGKKKSAVIFKFTLSRELSRGQFIKISNILYAREKNVKSYLMFSNTHGSVHLKPISPLIQEACHKMYTSWFMKLWGPKFLAVSETQLEILNTMQRLCKPSPALTTPQNPSARTTTANAESSRHKPFPASE